MKTILAALAAAVLTACGGGGGAGPESPATPPVAGTLGAPVPTATPQGAATAPLGAVSVDTVAPTPAPTVETPPLATPGGQPIPPRSGRSLNWWGTEPQMLFDVQNNCSPQPECRIPDGDLAVWNAQCEQNQYFAQCYVPLSFEPQVRPADRVGPLPPLGTPPATRPDPMTASEAEIAEWNRFCVTARCHVVAGVPS